MCSGSCFSLQIGQSANIRGRVRPMTPYETDIAAWAEQNAELIRARRWQEVDAEHVLEEIEALGNDRRNARDSQIQSGELNRPATGEYGLRAVALADP